MRYVSLVAVVITATKELGAERQPITANVVVNFQRRLTNVCESQRSERNAWRDNEKNKDCIEIEGVLQSLRRSKIMRQWGRKDGNDGWYLLFVTNTTDEEVVDGR